jgi:hypothetical protein
MCIRPEKKLSELDLHDDRCITRGGTILHSSFQVDTGALAISQLAILEMRVTPQTRQVRQPPRSPPCPSLFVPTVNQIKLTYLSYPPHTSTGVYSTFTSRMTYIHWLLPHWLLVHWFLPHGRASAPLTPTPFHPADFKPPRRVLLHYHL